MNKIFLFVSLCIAGFCTSYTIAQIISSGNSIKFKLSATNLPARDVDGLSDPYVKLFTASGASRHPAWMRFGETGVVQDSENPSWNEIFSYSFVNGSSQKWRFLVKDHDVGWYIDDHLGRVELNVDQYINELRKDNGTRQSQPVHLALTQPPGGVLIVTPIYDR